jgi:protein gp37
MSDLFHEAVPAEFVAAVWRAMHATPQHTYQILTKRPDRMAKITASLPVLPNVWLGTSVESVDYLWRTDDLRKVNAVVRFVSFEPLLGSVAAADLTGIHWAIVGGESGPRARPMPRKWSARSRRHARCKGGIFLQAVGGVRKKTTGRTIEGAPSMRCRAALLCKNHLPSPRNMCARARSDEAASPRSARGVD